MLAQNKITKYQLVNIMIHSQIGVGMITLPYEIFLKAGSDSWISVLLAGVIIQIIILIYARLMKRFPSHHLYEIIQLVFGKWIGKTIIVLYSIYFTILGGVFLAKYSFILKSWMMPLTPKWILILLILLLSVYTAIENLQVIARLLTLASIVLVIFIGISAFALKDAQITYILPIGNSGLTSIISGIPASLYSFIGFGYFIIIHPYVQSDYKGIVKTVTISNIIITLFNTFMVLTSLLFFSSKELKRIPEPVLYLVKSLNFNIIGRPDLIFTSMWIVLVVTTSIMMLYITSIGLVTGVGLGKRSIYVCIIAGLSYLIAANIFGRYMIDSVAKITNPFILIFTCVPIITLLFSIILKKKEGK